MTRAMATENIRIAHIPSTQLIGVEMVNLNRQTVRFQSLVDNETFINSINQTVDDITINSSNKDTEYNKGDTAEEEIA